MNPWSFHIGSCALKAFPFYLWSFQIFNTMNHRPSEFMVWMGDHVYMLKPWQWTSEKAMRKAYSNQRNSLRLKKYMLSRPQYAIWDDHDYGPNNAGAEFENKDTALKVFKDMWPNQNYASSKGIYHTFKHNEAQFFMTDGRYFKIKEEQLLGDEQLKWLCDELQKSKATFKFICMGTQAISNCQFENFRKYPHEYDYFMNYIHEHKIEGIIFMSGDVHFAEVSQLNRPNAYPLLDFTFSALTSFPTNFNTNNTYQIDDSKVNRNNFGEVTISGEEGKKVCTIRCISRKGQEYWSYNIPEEALKYAK